MLELLEASPLLLIFTVVAFGAALGLVPFGPIRLGAAGALFVGLAVGYFVPEAGVDLKLIQSLGLALFVYTVGLSAGQTFFSDLRRYARLLSGGVAVLCAAALVAIYGGRILGFESDLTAGIFAGALTTTPALAAASSAAGTQQPGVGYSIGYPVGVILAIIAVSIIVGRKWDERNDVSSLAEQELFAATAIVEKAISIREVPGWSQQKFKVSYLRRGAVTRIFVPGEELLVGDHIVLVGLKQDVENAVAVIGHFSSEHLADYRAHVEFTEFVVSRKDLAGNSVAALNMTGKFGAIVTRVHRGDLEFLATDDTVLEIGDRLKVALPREEIDAVSTFFGNSARTISEVDALSMGIAMAVGLLIGLVEFTLPGGAPFSLGAAAGPLIAGLLFGSLQKTGPFLWQMPLAANLTLRQLGLLLFLASVGITAGPAFVQLAFTAQGVQAGLLAAVIVAVVLAAVGVLGKVMGYSAQRTVGMMAGILGQPAVLAFASAKKNDERIESGYAAIFALGIIVKIVLAVLIVSF
ncbi:MAG: TrkA C-terminal domain-containing protein [Arcanobacterium sp.]|nr:TrkA C-terminal domain-containing protein [Arcanobacterium sp.]